ncbi:uncharacterized protein CLUP02_13936 [Colletotrichum lupini]|uniref:Uncharacterized protein n=1 Tax=Colletotrichum lupini TaxID=145971 RepID=A0A9Q8T564_9PEZI|nr:uncharacterized protein CLUP02_13936 [Colletotrichum lupini]UQC88412.1 hypothetical protein CLUP02_13936 [Colletotrichum lupini]
MNPAGGSNQNQHTNHRIQADLPRTTTPSETTSFHIGHNRNHWFSRLLYSTRNSKHSALPAPVRPRRRRTGVRHVEKPVAQLDDGGIVPGVYVLGEQQPSRSPKDPPFPNSFFDFIRVTLKQQ